MTAIAGAWRSRWEGFLDQHPDWRDRANRADPIYALPEMVINDLARSAHSSAVTKGGPPAKTFISQDAAGAELDFLDLCRETSASCVAVLNGLPLEYPFLAAGMSPAAQSTDRFGCGFIKLPGVLARPVAELTDYFVGDQHQMLDYAGQLNLNQRYGPYREQRGALLSQYEALLTPPGFPLALTSNQGLGGQGAPRNRRPRSKGGKEAAAFQRDVEEFLRRWNLLGLVSWDLPVPFPALKNIPLGLALNLLGPEHQVCTFPQYHDIPCSWDVRKMIRSPFGTDDNGGTRIRTPTGNAPSEYESAFRLWLIEWSVRARHGTIPGTVERLEETFAGLLHRSRDWVGQLRKLYTARLRSV
ncbi:MAG: hypothetical protein P4L84_05885 [Isosphaeraceae bacterium]|nr:hypothetical protein [Isosphaeraceae bacterium]